MSVVFLLLVALRKESVDRNAPKPNTKATEKVALRKESVDRNIVIISSNTVDHMSLSARRAWIEMAELRMFRMD